MTSSLQDLSEQWALVHNSVVCSELRRTNCYVTLDWLSTQLNTNCLRLSCLSGPLWGRCEPQACTCTMNLMPKTKLIKILLLTPQTQAKSQCASTFRKLKSSVGKVWPSTQTTPAVLYLERAAVENSRGIQIHSYQYGRISNLYDSS